MAKSATIQVRVDEDTKVQSQNILAKLHITLSEAIAMYLRQIIYHRGIPFEIRVPNTETLKAVQDAESGKGLKEFSSVDELFKDLES